MQVKSRLTDQEYRNWVEVGQALLCLSDMVQYHVSKGISAFYEVLTKKISSGAIFSSRSARGRPNVRRSEWVQAILSYHRNPTKVVWTDTDNSKWDDPFLGPREIASVYTGVQSVNGIKYLQFLRFCSYNNVSEKVIMDVIHVWETLWGEPSNQKLGYEEKLYAFDSMTKLLHEPLFSKDPSTKTMIKDIQSLENWDVTRLQLSEVKVARTYQQLLESKKFQLTKGIAELDRNLDRVESFLADAQDSSQNTTLLPRQASFTRKSREILFSSMGSISLFLHRSSSVLGLVIIFVALGSFTIVFALQTSKYITKRA